MQKMRSGWLTVLVTMALVAAAWVGAMKVLGQDAPPAGTNAVATADGGVVGVDPAAVANAAAGVLTPVLEGLAGKYGWLTTVLLAIGTLRLFLKPLISALHSYAERTATTKDDEWIARVENSRWLKCTVWTLDWVSSIKLVRK